MHVRAVDALPCQNDVLSCQNDALSCQSRDMLHLVRPIKRSMCTRPFSSLNAGSGNETNGLAELNEHRKLIKPDV